MPAPSSLRRAAVILILGTATACGGDAAPRDTAASAPAAPAISFDTARITPAMVALGDSLFHGRIGATSCQACHGVAGRNGVAAPDLADGRWLHGDGSFEFIFRTIKSGVMAPKEFSSVMPPYGGVTMTDDRTLAVAAYVYRLNNP
ncbi:MAG: c-type cytochrome [Gemmatimonadaceae bacterium]